MLSIQEFRNDIQEYQVYTGNIFSIFSIRGIYASM